jgi:hypothetical protein
MAFPVMQQGPPKTVKGERVGRGHLRPQRVRQFGSLAILLGGLAQIAPKRRGSVARAVLPGTLATSSTPPWPGYLLAVLGEEPGHGRAEGGRGLDPG